MRRNLINSRAKIGFILILTGLAIFFLCIFLEVTIFREAIINSDEEHQIYPARLVIDLSKSLPFLAFTGILFILYDKNLKKYRKLKNANLILLFFTMLMLAMTLVDLIGIFFGPIPVDLDLPYDSLIVSIIIPIINLFIIGLLALYLIYFYSAVNGFRNFSTSDVKKNITNID